MSLPRDILYGLLREIVLELVEKCGKIYQVILYGSYARGDAGPKSDVDLLIIGEEPKRCEEIALSVSVEKGLPILQPVALSPGELGDPGKKRLYVNALLEGYLLYQSIGAEPVKTAPPSYRVHLLVRYRAPPRFRRKLTGTTVVQRGYRMRARGLIEKMGGARLAPGLFMIEAAKWPPLEIILQKHGVEYEIIKIVLAPHSG